MAAPNTFANKTGQVQLSLLDGNFSYVDTELTTLQTNIDTVQSNLDALDLNNITGDVVIDGSITATSGIRDLGTSTVKTSSYTLATTDKGKYVHVGTGGSITIPNSIFSEGDAISIFNNTSGDITITCSISTAYIAGDNTNVSTMTLASRGVCTILFVSGTLCVVTGNVS